MKIAQLITFAIVALLFVDFSFGQSKSKNAQQSSEKMQKFSVADGWLQFEAPSTWKSLPRKINFIHADFSIPKSEGDPKDGRISFSQVGGGIDANLTRWVGQFKNVDSEDEDQVKRETKKIAGNDVQLINIKGTFLDSAGGPFGPKTERENYILMGAAIKSDSGSDVYIKAYGPEKTMKANRKAIEALIAGMQAADG